MSDRLGDWTALVDACYPEADAADWDQVGLQVGDPEDPVTAVLVSLDVTAAVLEEAAARGADLVLAHHPLLFRPLARLTPDTASGKLALAAARAGIGVLAAHTNFDVATPGTSEPVTRLLELRAVRPLQPLADRAARVKLVTFVPPDDTPAVLAALAAAGAGVIGEYDTCSFRLRGTGTFRPSAAAAPAVGEREQLNQVAEDRLEMVVDRARLGAAVTALLDAHPYEEVAYDVHPLLEGSPAADGRGLGRIGTLPAPLPLRAVAARVAQQLPSPHLRVSGDLDAPVTTVAVCGGAGASLIDAARAAGADVYVTGDLRHHAVLDALTDGLALIDAGHHATEVAALPALRERLSAAALQRGLQARLLASATCTDPWNGWAPPPAPETSTPGAQ